MEENNHLKMSATNTFSLETLGFITFIVFLILKVTGTWDIDWFWVWFPLWFPLALSLAIFVIIFIIVLILALLDIV